MELSMKKITLIIICCLFASISLYARGTAEAIIVNPYFDFGYVNPADINDKITMDPGGVATFVPDAGTLHWAKNIGAFVGYKFNHRFTVGLIFDRIAYATVIMAENSSGFSVWHPSQTTKNTAITGAKFYEFSTGGSAFSFGPAFYYNVYSGGKLAFDAGLGVLYGKASYYEDASYSLVSSSSGVKTASITGSGSAFGFQLNTSTTYYFTNYLGMSLDLGYRYLKCSSLTDPNGTPLKFQFNNGQTDATNMSIDFSGIYFGFGLKIDFNIAGSGAAPSVIDSKPTEEQSLNDKPAAGSEMSSSWETSPAPTEEGPKVEEIRELKKQVQRKYNEAKTSSDLDAQAKAERYQKLYDITNRLEKDWDQFSAKSRKDRIEKIKLIMSR
jgi:hypothetical protein